MNVTVSMHVRDLAELAVTYWPDNGETGGYLTLDVGIDLGTRSHIYLPIDGTAARLRALADEIDAATSEATT